MPPHPDEAAQPIKYQFTDNSVTRPALTRLWFTPLFPLVPRWLTANFVSLLATGSLLVVLALSLAPNALSPTWTALVFFAAVQVYLAGDHLDGMQAIATGTASPLGDFVDHYCDLWAGCILVFGFWALMGTAMRGALYAMTVLMIVCFATTYAEREAERKLHFTRLGALEADLILSAFLLTWAIPSVREWWQSTSPAGVPWYAFAIGVVAAIGVGTIVVIVRRMGRVSMPLLLEVGALGALAVMLTRRVELPAIEGWLLLVLFGGRYVASVMHGYLMPGRRSWPDPVACVAILVLAAWELTTGIPAPAAREGAMIFGAYLAITLTITLFTIVGGLRRYWVWMNPTLVRSRE